jgi:LEA14-like dessication related protein
MKRAAKIILVSLLIVLVSCLGLFLKNPTILLKEIHIRPVSLKDLEIRLVMEIQNPNRFDLRLTAFDYTVFLDEKEMGKGDIQKEILVPGAASQTVDIPLTVHLGDMGETVKLLLSDRELPYRIEGTARVKTGIGSAAIPYSKTGNIRPIKKIF